MAIRHRRQPANAVATLRRVVLLATPNAQSLELAGPIEVFALAEQKLREAGRNHARGYEVEIVSALHDRHIRSSSGLTVIADRRFDEITDTIDTLLVAGGMNLWSAAGETELLQWLRATAPSIRRFGSVCTGAFLLAEAGLLSGRRVTTHWYFCSELARRFPESIVDPEPIFVRDGNVYTSAGVAAGIDLALAMVEEDLGLDIALRIARALVLFLRRPSGQNQFSTSLALQASSRLPIRELPIYILENMAERLSVEDLAERVSMSSRNFARIFRQEFNEAPGAFVQRLRVETAKRLLLESNLSLEEIASMCGLGEQDAMRASFRRAYKQTPTEVRAGRK